MEPISLGILPYYHKTGDVTFQVTNNAVQYNLRLHHHILSWHSPVWKDMFELGVTHDVPDLGIVNIEDPLRDICSLIWAFYYGLDEFNKHPQLREALGFVTLAQLGVDIPELADLDITLGLLKISHKYQADRIYKAVVNLLLQSWPLNPKTYFAIEGRPRFENSASLIKAAWAINCPVLLPIAFYKLGTVTVAKWNENGRGVNKLPEFEPHTLRLFLGKGQISTRYHDFIGDLLREYSLNTYGAYLCNCDRKTILEKLQIMIYSCLVPDATPNLERTMVWTSLEHIGAEGCEGCSQWIFNLLRNLEGEIWHDLTTYFDLPPVDEEYRLPPEYKIFQ